MDRISEADVGKRLGLKDDDDIPSKFHKDKVTPVNPDAIVWFDEVHRDCFVGDLGARVTRQWQFPRNENGDYNENGTFNEPAKECTFKYDAQARFSLGVAQKEVFVDGQWMLVAYRLPLFGYTGKTMKSGLDMKKMIEDEIRRVKK